MSDVTTYKAIETPSGHIRLSIVKVNNKWNRQPFLEFIEIKYTCWDNSDYLLSLFRAIKKGKKTKKVKELEQFCNENNLNFKETKEDLLAIFVEAKKLRFWKKK